MSNAPNIVLTGFMGTGKSTIGALLAQRLNRAFVDMDEVIERRTGLTIPRIFALHSEPFFRAMERGLSHELATQTGLVIATGGGALVEEELQELMGKRGMVVCLTADPDTIQHRIESNDARPLAGEWRELLEARQAAYDTISHQIDTSDNMPDEIVQEIIHLLSPPITVKSPVSNYNIFIEPGLLDDLGHHVGEYHLDRPAVIVTNTTLAPLYGEQLARRLPDAKLITMGDGEGYKNLETVAQLYRDLLKLGADRNTILIALGGGVVGDTVGYVAATYMRGIRLLQIPTSLLAMVDSSVGGKVGVDLPQGKNLVGAFKQPDMVLIDPDVLQTLPTAQWHCGMAEIIKHGLLADEKLLGAEIREPVRVAELVRRAVQVKVNVVQQDPYEENIRAHLNLGHTFGHAIEQVTAYDWLHGEGVGIGLLAAIKLSNQLGLCDLSLVEQVESILLEIGLPTHLGALDPEAIYAAMSTDKKWNHGKSRFVLLHDIGKPTIVEDVAKEQVLAVLKSIQ